MAGAFLAAFTLRVPRRRQPITPTGLAAVAAGTAAVGVLGAIASSSAVSNRYFAVAIPLVVITAGVGLWRIAGRLLWLALLAFGVAGAILAVVDLRTARTTAPACVAELAAQARPGDLVIYCPDQLAPATHRLLQRTGLDARRVGVPDRLDAGAASTGSTTRTGRWPPIPRPPPRPRWRRPATTPSGSSSAPPTRRPRRRAVASSTR